MPCRCVDFSGLDPSSSQNEAAHLRKRPLDAAIGTEGRPRAYMVDLDLNWLSLPCQLDNMYRK